MAGGRVHGLGDADVGADGGAEEVERPEGGDDAEVEFPGQGVSGIGKLTNHHNLPMEMGILSGGGRGSGSETGGTNR